jgi:Family of unknown function (DUF6183)
VPPIDDDELDAVIHAADLDGLIRLIENRTSGRDWEGLLRVRNRSRAALESGRQLWPAATLAEYRLALWAPPMWAAIVISEDAGKFAIGPLTEVVAQGHTWAEMEPHLPDGPRTAIVAQERALRGDNVADLVFDDDPLELPYRTFDWEPVYPLAVYSDDGMVCNPPPTPVATQPIDWPPGRPTLVNDPDITRAARQLIEPWLDSSNGRFEFVGVEGGPANALLALGVPEQQGRVAPLTPAEGLAWLAWAGASGGAHGRRRGAAAGRFAAWWFLASLGGFSDEWPPDQAELGELVNELQWFWWDASEPAVGWRLQVLIHDPTEDVSWIVNATDAAS